MQTINFAENLCSKICVTEEGRKLKWISLNVEDFCVEVDFFFTINKGTSTFIREMRVRVSNIVQNTVAQNLLFIQILIQLLQTVIKLQPLIFNWRLEPNLNDHQFWGGH